MRSTLLIGLVLSMALPALAQKGEIAIPRKYTRPPGPALSPQEAIAKMEVPEGFTVEVVASEPDIVNPVAMTFDEQGRVWITESLEYPRLSPGPGRDRVKVLEDTNGDGKMNKVTVFADGLNIPSGIAVGYGGVWVANSPDILFLQDTDGDGKADKKEVVVTGFGRTDTHELPNSLTWGPDGYLYGLNGVFNHSHVTHKGKEYRFTCAVFRINPRTRDFEIFAEGTSNPWGIAWDPEGSAFLSACVIDHLWHITESGYYHRQGGPYPPFTWKIGSIVKHKHQKAAYCGIHYFDSDAYPEKYRDRLYMGNIHGNCINVDVLERDGSTYFAKPNPDFLTANDDWFMPVAQKTGPDGCLYILDWYDRYHCYQDARRDPKGLDRLKGRLYRIRYKDTPRAKPFDLGADLDFRLVQRLHSKNVYFRTVAQRMLSERARPGTQRDLQELVFDESAARKTRLHALWALIGTGKLDPEFHAKVLAADDASFRAWGVRAAGNFRRVAEPISRRIASLAADESPDVRLQVAIAAPKIEAVETMPALVEVLHRSGDDTLIPHIVWQNLHPLLEERTPEFLAAAESEEFAGSASVSALMPRVIDRILALKKPAPTAIARLFRLLQAGEGNIEAARKCLALLSSRVQSGELSGKQLEALREVLSEQLADIAAQGKEGPLYLDATLLAASWGDESALRVAQRMAENETSPEAKRQAALAALIAAGDASAIPQAGQILRQSKRTSLDFRSSVVAMLGRLDDSKVAATVLGVYPSMEPELKPKAIELLTQRKDWAKALLAEIDKERIPANALNVNQVRKLLATGDEELEKTVAAVWGTVRTERNPAREKVIAEMRRFLRSHPGDAHKGQVIYKKVCGQCHKIYGEGQEVGPEITRNGRGSFEQLLSNVFDPSLVIGASYQAQSVITTDGRVLTGLVVEDSPQRLVLKVQGGKEEIIPVEKIDERKVSKLSLMPEDLEKQLKPEELADLFAFLTLDKPPSDPAARKIPGAEAVEPRETTNPEEFGALIDEVLPGFTTKASGEGGVALLAEHSGRPAVVQTHPVDRKTPCVLSRRVAIPAGKRAELVLAVSHHPKGDWRLRVRANGKTVHESDVSSKSCPDGWREIRVDLSDFAGKTVELELGNQANGWSWEFAYWGRAEVVVR